MNPPKSLRHSMHMDELRPTSFLQFYKEEGLCRNHHQIKKEKCGSSQIRSCLNSKKESKSNKKSIEIQNLGRVESS